MIHGQEQEPGYDEVLALAAILLLCGLAAQPGFLPAVPAPAQAAPGKAVVTPARASRGGKNRRAGIKREHAVIQGLTEALQPVTALPSVSVCIPGRIRKTRTRPGPFLTVQAETPDGLKLAAHGRGCIQEVFIVTSDRDAVRAVIRGEQP